MDADYSQIELRVLAHLSGDERLIEAYKKAEDIHAITASEVFHVPFGSGDASRRGETPRQSTLESSTASAPLA